MSVSQNCGHIQEISQATNLLLEITNPVEGFGWWSVGVVCVRRASGLLCALCRFLVVRFACWIMGFGLWDARMEVPQKIYSQDEIFLWPRL